MPFKDQFHYKTFKHFITKGPKSKSHNFTSFYLELTFWSNSWPKSSTYPKPHPISSSFTSHPSKAFKFFTVFDDVQDFFICHRLLHDSHLEFMPCIVPCLAIWYPLPKSSWSLPYLKPSNPSCNNRKYQHHSHTQKHVSS